MKIVRDLALIPIARRKFLAYSPNKRVLAMINKDAAVLIKLLSESQLSENDPIITTQVSDFISFLTDHGLYTEEDILLPEQPKANLYPTEAMLLPTFNCNLRCVYCYANSGDGPHDTMNIKVARATVDLLIKNAVKKQQKKIIIAFHGGGEPTIAWELLQNIFDYAQQEVSHMGLEVDISITTNGVLTTEQLEWMITNHIGIQISFDGPPDIQNSQRPLANGKGSFDYTYSSVDYLVKLNYPFGIQSVITNNSVKRMIEIIDFFSNSFRIKDIHFEPLFECGRCQYSGWGEPSPSEYTERFVEAWKYAASRSINLHTSLSRLDTLTSFFCGASGQNFIITPNGFVTACLEVSSIIDNRSETFIYGSYKEDRGCFELETKKLEFLATRNIHNLPNCVSCPIAWHCGGDCLAKSVSLEKLFDPSSSNRCIMAKEITTLQLLTILDNPSIAEVMGIKLLDL